MIGIKKLILIAVAIRLVLAPFFAHPWDMGTIQDSLYLLFNGVNPYEHFSSISIDLQAASGLPIFYEGYAYLPHLLFIFAPFYGLYLLTGADPTPINKFVLLSSPVDIWFSPDIFLFLSIMKLPLIAMDVLAVYFLHKLKPRIGVLYALSPYVILVTAVWGMFDSVLAVSLLLSVLLFHKHKFLSGIFFGLSLIKPITLLALPIYFVVMLREKEYKGLLVFLSAVFLTQIPSLFYLFLDSRSFLNTVVFFHLKRVGGGVTPLNILWNIPDLLFNITATSYASLVFLIAYAVLLFFVVKKRVLFEYGVIIMIMLYMFLGKLINEQYLLIIYPLLLWKLESARSLEKYLIVFTLINTTPLYFALPLLGIFKFYLPLLNTWYSFLSINYISFARFVLFYLVGLLFFLKVADLTWLTYRKNIRATQETHKSKPNGRSSKPPRLAFETISK